MTLSRLAPAVLLKFTGKRRVLDFSLVRTRQGMGVVVFSLSLVCVKMQVGIVMAAMVVARTTVLLVVAGELGVRSSPIQGVRTVLTVRDVLLLVMAVTLHTGVVTSDTILGRPEKLNVFPDLVHLDAYIFRQFTVHWS